MAQGLVSDGIVGPNTWKELLKDYNKPLSSKDEIGKIVKRKSLSGIISSSESNTDISDVLRLALADIGKVESPSGSNSGPDIEHLVGGYHEYWKISEKEYPNLPWCAMAVSRWIFYGLGITDWKDHPFGGFYGGCSQIENWGKKHGKFFTVENDGVPPAGSVFLMSRASSGSDATKATKAGHTGLVVSVQNEEVTTIEGNVANSVTTKNRKLSSLTGYVTWWE
jgi:hypothetical protein